MKKTLKSIFLFIYIPCLLWAESKCPPPYLSELDVAKSVIEFNLSGGKNTYMQDKNICLKQDDFPYIKIEEVEEGENNEGNPKYFVQSKHNFTITSLKKIKRDLGLDYYKVVFTVDTIKEKKKVKLDIVIDYMIDLNSGTDFSSGCVWDSLSSHLDAVYQECYDSVQSQYDQEEEKGQ